MLEAWTGGLTFPGTFFPSSKTSSIHSSLKDNILWYSPVQAWGTGATHRWARVGTPVMRTGLNNPEFHYYPDTTFPSVPLTAVKCAQNNNRYTWRGQGPNGREDNGQLVGTQGLKTINLWAVNTNFRY